MTPPGPLWRNGPRLRAAWRPLLATAAVVWAAPAALGAVLLATAYLFGGHLGESGLTLWALALALTFSPLLSWIGWLAALPAVWFLLREGRFGWVPAGLVGLACGLVAGWITGTGLAAAFGLVSLIALRWLLAAAAAPG